MTDIFQIDKRGDESLLHTNDTPLASVPMYNIGISNKPTSNSKVGSAVQSGKKMIKKQKNKQNRIQRKQDAAVNRNRIAAPLNKNGSAGVKTRSPAKNERRNANDSAKRRAMQRREDAEMHLEIMRDFVENCDNVNTSYTKLATLSCSEDCSSSHAEEGVYDQLRFLAESQWSSESDSDDSFESDSGDSLVASEDLYNSTSSGSSDIDQKYASSMSSGSNESDTEFLRKEFAGVNTWEDDYLESPSKTKAEHRIDRIINGSFSDEVMGFRAREVTKSSKKKDAKRLKKKLVKEQRNQSSNRKNCTRVLEDNFNSEVAGFLKDINIQIHGLVKSTTMESTILPQMPSVVRKMLRTILRAYGVTLVNRGAGKKKVSVIYCNSQSMIPANWANLSENVLATHGMKLERMKERGGKVPKESKGKRYTKGNAKETAKRSNEANGTPKPNAGDVVGAKAKPLCEQNKGHRMLQAMGWTPGESLGAEDTGIKQPIQVTIRSKRGGLGAE